MKNILLLLFLTVSFFACKPEPEEKQPNQHIYSYLTKEQLAKTPYFTNPAFDTLSFVSNLNDTLTFVKTKTDSGFYEENYKDHPSGPTNYLYHQYVQNSYKTIKGDGSFWVRHSKNNWAFNIMLPDFIQITFNGHNFYLRDYFLGINHSTTIDTIKINNQVYLQNTKLNNNRQDSSTAQAYINKDFGVFKIFDYKNSKEWALTN